VMSFFKQNKPKQTSKEKDEKSQKEELFEKDITFNIRRMKELFHYPINKTLKIRELELPFYHKKTMLVFIEGTVNTDTIDAHIVEALLKETRIPIPSENFAQML